MSSRHKRVSKRRTIHCFNNGNSAIMYLCRGSIAMFTGAWKCRMELNSSGISKFTEKWRISRTSQEFSKQVSGNFPFHSILCWNFGKFSLFNGTILRLMTPRKQTVLYFITTNVCIVAKKMSFVQTRHYFK